MRYPALIATALIGLASAAFAAFAEDTDLYNPAIKHIPKDGVVKLYGAGGPHTAFQKVADSWSQKTSQKIEIIAGPESKWSADAQADADILRGT